MLKTVYSVFDEKAQVFFNPFYFVHDGQALRAFEQVTKDPQSEISRYPGDYKLYKLGTFDDTTGVMCSNQPPVFLANATDFVNKSVVKADTEGVAEGV